MNARTWLLILTTLTSTSACLVSSFEVTDSTDDIDAPGGMSNGGMATGGTQSTAGHAGNAKAGADANGGTIANGGMQSSGGQTGVAGDNSGGAPEGPYRVGFTEFQDSASGDNQASAGLANATFALPPGTQEGDLLLVFLGADHSLLNLDAAALTPLGWKIQLAEKDVGTDGQGTYLLYRFASKSEIDPVVFKNINNPPGIANGVQGLLSVYRGVDPAEPFNAFEVATIMTGTMGLSEVTTATPALTTTVDGCLLLAGLSPDSAIDAPTITMWPDGFDRNRVSVVNPEKPSPYGWTSIYAAEQLQASAGTLPASQFTWALQNSTEYYGSLSFVLALAPAR